MESIKIEVEVTTQDVLAALDREYGAGFIESILGLDIAKRMVLSKPDEGYAVNTIEISLANGVLRVTVADMPEVLLVR